MACHVFTCDTMAAWRRTYSFQTYRLPCVEIIIEACKVVQNTLWTASVDAVKPGWGLDRAVVLRHTCTRVLEEIYTSHLRCVPGSVSQSRQDVKRSKHNVSARLLPEVTFSTLVLHRISVYITWPATPPGDQCNGIKSQVVGYRLRYQPTDDVGEFISQTLSENYILLENLSSGVKYRYHVKYLLENGGETPWSVEGLFDTTPSHQWLNVNKVYRSTST